MTKSKPNQESNMNVIEKIKSLPYRLSKGRHESPKQGMCAMEMASFLNGEEWSDHPKCVSPVVAAFARIINDKMPQDYRDKLQLRMLDMMQTSGDSLDQERCEFLAWKAIKVFAPIALYKAGIPKHAIILRKFDPSLGLKDARSAAESASESAACSAAGAEEWGEALLALDGLLEIGKPLESEFSVTAEKFIDLDNALEVA